MPNISKYFITIWLLPLIVQFLGIVHYKPNSLIVYGSVILSMIACLLGIQVGKGIAKTTQTLEKANVPILRIPSLKFINVVILISYVSIVAGCLKIKSWMSEYGFSLSLAGATEFRYANEDFGYEQGGNIFGIIGTMFFAFNMLAAVILVFYYSFLSSKHKLLLFIPLLWSLVYPLTSGGRNGTVFSLIFIFFAALIRIKLLAPFVGSRSIQNYTRILKMAKITSLVFLGVFLAIFLERFKYMDISYLDYYDFIQFDRNFKTLTWIEEIIRRDDMIGAITFTLLFLIDYIAQGISELNTTLTFEPKSFPYYGSFQFYIFLFLLGKFGFNFIQPDQLVAELPNPGTYFTLIGAAYLDFGPFLMYLFLFILFIFYAYFYYRARLVISIKNIFIAISFIVIVLFSPMFSAISSSSFPSIIIVTFFLMFFPGKFLSAKVYRENSIKD